QRSSSVASDRRCSWPDGLLRRQLPRRAARTGRASRRHSRRSTSGASSLLESGPSRDETHRLYVWRRGPVNQAQKSPASAGAFRIAGAGFEPATFGFPEVQAKIATLIRVGNSAEVAAGAAGISRSSFFSWLAKGHAETTGRYRAFREAVDQARAESES